MSIYKAPKWIFKGSYDWFIDHYADVDTLCGTLDVCTSVTKTGVKPVIGLGFQHKNCRNIYLSCRRK